MIIDEWFENSDSDNSTIPVLELGVPTDRDILTLEVQSLENLDIVSDAAAHTRLKARLVNHSSSRN
jgi:hypothetical protein